MQKKLTLRIEEKVIKKAKVIAKRNGKSVSKIVEDYFSNIPVKGQKDQEQLTPKVRSLKGLLKNSKIDKKEYYDYLEKKHQ